MSAPAHVDSTLDSTAVAETEAAAGAETAVTAGTVDQICVVHALKPDRGIGVTAIDKRAVEGSVKVTKVGIYADVQADRVHHGGFDQAIYAYSSDEAGRWASELGREIPAGFFGENLRVSGLPTTDAIVGERWRIGRDVVVEVTMPRTPCSTFARHMDEQAWVSRFTDRGDVGCYLKVVRVGKIRAGDSIELISTPGHGVSVREVFTGPTAEQAQAMLADQAAGGNLLPEKITRKIEQLGLTS